MKKVILVASLLLAASSFAGARQSNTDTAMDSECRSKTLFKKQAEIEQLIANDEKGQKVNSSKKFHTRKR